MRLGALIFAILVMPKGGFTQPKAEKEFFFLEDAEHRQWCGYANRPDWKAATQSLSAMIVGVVEYTKSRASTVLVTETDETGDWAVYDEYLLDHNERLQKLKRTIDVLPGRITETQIFRLENGKATQETSSTRDLGTGKPTQFPGGNWRPDIPVITNVQAFAFWPLVRGKHTEIFSKGSVCIPEH